jgi:hypothetical protein
VRSSEEASLYCRVMAISGYESLLVQERNLPLAMPWLDQSDVRIKRDMSQ